MIVILTDASDVHADAVERLLGNRGAEFIRMDPGQVGLDGGSLVARVGGGALQLVVGTPGAAVDLAQASAVWIRRPSRVSPREELTDSFFRWQTETAWLNVMDDLYRATDCPWLPARPCDLRRADSKLRQLKVASELGFVIPDTLIASDSEAIFDFHRAHCGRLISKLPASFPIPKPAPPFGRYTERVLRSDLGYIATSSHFGPCLFQPEIEKRVELRITVVGQRVFAVEIASQANRRTALDWRHYDVEHTPHRMYALPREVEERCVALVRALGLNYGAIDVIETPGGDYVFLEVNPSGQYLWIEEVTGAPITAAICDFLMGERSS